MTEKSDTRTRQLYSEQRAENVKLAAKLNAFWAEQGIQANARVVERKFDFGDYKVVSAEIASDLGSLVGVP